jgi:ketosteroid isomerase-like protein
MDKVKMNELAVSFLDEWNSQDVERVVATYTDDVIYSDPNTRGKVNGAEDLRRYLVKLFDAWQMTWALKEAFLFEGGDGCAVLWHATIRKTGGSKVVEFDGMDLVLVRGERISRNEVNFDRATLLPLMQED